MVIAAGNAVVLHLMRKQLLQHRKYVIAGLFDWISSAVSSTAEEEEITFLGNHQIERLSQEKQSCPPNLWAASGGRSSLFVIAALH